MNKRILSLVLALVMVLGTFGTVFAAATTPTANEKVDKLIELGLVKGYGDGTYGLAQAITRAEVATMVVRALDLEAVANASANFPSQFADMNSANVLWARGFVNVAAGQGIIIGYPNGLFVPAGNITYAEGAKMLVEVLGGLTDAEKANYSWPTTYLAKAAQLGIFADVDGIVDYNAPALRENLFEMVFNTLMAGTDLLIASTVEGIVVENYRTETLAKDEVVVHVMKDQIAKSSDVEEGKYYEESDEFKVTITAELKEKGIDVETLLGKVVKVSFDKENKVVGIEINNDYDYLEGALTDVSSKEIEVADKYYTVGKAEAKSAVDERLYQLYVNNDDVRYADFDEADAEYANITVRNGKVLFIDAFLFEDVAPVAKEADSKDKVSFYNDEADGELDTLEVDEDAYVINFVDGEMSLGNYKDIAVNDVMHWFEDDKDNLTVFVRPVDDSKVEGEYDEVKAARANDSFDIELVVDGDDYPAVIGEDANADFNRGPVYSVNATDFEFYALTEDYDVELEDFEDEEVVLLRDMFDNVQLISTEKVDARFYAVIDDIYNYDFELLKTDNESEWYDSNRNTVFKEDGEKMDDTREKNLTAFDEDALVLAKADGETLTELDLLTADKEGDITRFTNDVIVVDGETFYIGNKAVLFYVEGTTNKAMSVKDFRSNYVEVGSTGYVVLNDKDVVVAIVIDDSTAEKDSDDYETVEVKVTDVRSSGGKYRINTENAAETEAIYWAEEDSALEIALINKNVQKGDIIKISVPVEADKDDRKYVDEFISELIDVKEAVFEVKATDGKTRGERWLTLEDTNGVVDTIWIARNADVFGSYKVGSFVAITPIDADNVTLALDVKAAKDYVTPPTAVWADYTAALAETPAELLVEATEAVVLAQTSQLPADIAAARELVDALPAGADKDDLLADLLAITPIVVTGVKATGAVTTAGVDEVLPVNAVKAQIDIYTDLELVAKTAGIAGNQITIAVKQLVGLNQEFGVVVTGKNIVVNLGTDAAGNAVAVSETEVVTAINTNATASALVVATGGTAADAVVQTILALKDGADAVVAVVPVPEVYTLTVTNGATVAGKIKVSGADADVTIAVTAGMTAAQVAAAIQTSVVATDYTTTVVGNTVVFTNTAANGNVTDLAITVVDVL